MKDVILKIIDLDSNARGVARNEGMIFFVENAKLGQLVRAEVVKEKKSFVEARLVEVLEESPFLISEKIAEANLCGVYDLHDLQYAKQVEFKKNNIINQINRIAGENLDNIDFVEANKIYGYRNKVELKVSPDGKISYFSRASHDNVVVEKCVMNTEEINSVLQVLQELILKHNIPGYDTRSNKGCIKNLIIRSTSLGETMIILVYSDSHDFTSFIEDLKNSKIVDSFYMSKNTKPRNYKMIKVNHIFGLEKINEDLGEYSFKISPKAFMQVNKEISLQMYNKARDFLKSIKPQILLDLYSGISTTSVLLADFIPEILAVEINQDAVEDAKENARINGIQNIKWINKAAEEAIKEIDVDNNKTAILVDPPRKGLDKTIIDIVNDSKINDLVYISCNPSTFARDLKLFKEGGFYLETLTGFDQFVNTLETEIVAKIKRERNV